MIHTSQGLSTGCHHCQLHADQIQAKGSIEHLPILKKKVIVVIMLCAHPQITEVVAREEKLCSNPVCGKINE